MKPYRRIVLKGSVMIWLSLVVLMGHAGYVSGESSFTTEASFDHGVAVAPEMMVTDPRTLIVNFGDPNEVAQVVPSDDQEFDFQAVGGASVESEPTPAEPLSNTMSEAPEASSAAIPEPSSILLLSLGLLFVISGLWRKGHRRGSHSA